MRAVLFLLCLLPGGSHVTGQVVRQRPMGRNACGPCAFINSLTTAQNEIALNRLPGDSPLDKSKSIVSKYGSSQSTPFGIHRTAYSDEHGTTDVDLKVMVNRTFTDVGQGAVAGVYLERTANETSADFVRRVQQLFQQSIDHGFHPLLSIRAMAAQFDEAQEQTNWNSLGGHWIAVHGVTDIGADGLSFQIDFSDSLSGTRQSGFVHFDRHRRARVPMTFTVDDKGHEVWNWVASDKALMLTAPGMPLGTRRARWYERTYIALRYVVFRDEADAGR